MTMSFTAKKCIASLLLPLPIVLILGLIGLLLVIGRYKKSGITLLTISWLTLALFSTSAIPNQLLGHLEKQYQPLLSIPRSIHRIVVLGGGVRNGMAYPPNAHLNSASLARLIEGVRLYRQYTAHSTQTMTLILSGGRVFGLPSEAGKMKNTAVMLGVPSDHIVLEAGSRDTLEEAKKLKPILGNQPFVLVTSAAHMPRAYAIFTQMGLHPTPAPTQYLTIHARPNIACGWIPHSINIVHADIAIHEYLGIAWGKLLGFIH